MAIVCEINDKNGKKYLQDYRIDGIIEYREKLNNLKEVYIKSKRISDLISCIPNNLNVEDFCIVEYEDGYALGSV